MRTLVLAAILSLLAGCSLPYVDTSFSATPKPEHIAEGVKHESNDEEPSEEGGRKQVGIAMRMYEGDVDGPPSPSGAGEGSAFPNSQTRSMGRTGVAFPPTAQPTGE